MFYYVSGIDLLLGSPVASGDLESKTLTLASGETLSYGSLILATGSSVR